MTLIPRPGLHGGDGSRIAAALGIDPATVLDLSASLNPVAPDVGAIVSRHLSVLHRYPDPEAATAALAEVMGVDRHRLLLTNGGAEAIALLSAQVGGHVVEPDFALYPRGPSGPRWRSDPHNPTGALAGPDEQAEVWDEAFYPLATGRWTSADRALVVGSLTKTFACPGLRIGYVLADPDVIARLRRRQPTWSVNGLAAAALPDLLERADLAWWAKAIAGLRAELRALLESTGLEPHPSDAPFVLCAKGAGVRDHLAARGIVVRDCASFGLPGQVRVAVPDDVGLARLGEALRQRE